MKNRKAWGLVLVLAVLVLPSAVVGLRVMFTDGVQVGSDRYWLRWDGRWTTGPDATWCDLGMCGTSYHLGYLSLAHSFPDPDPVYVKQRQRVGRVTR
jgi:hypothetical protein